MCRKERYLAETSGCGLDGTVHEQHGGERRWLHSNKLHLEADSKHNAVD